jgi:hypothetical protein
VWKEGCDSPVSQEVDQEIAISITERQRVRLPARFEIYTSCACGCVVEAVGRTSTSGWTNTKLLDETNAVPYPDENERQFKTRLKKYQEGR